MTLIPSIFLLSLVYSAESFTKSVSFVPRRCQSKTVLSVDAGWIQGGAIAAAGLAVGGGIPAYIEFAGKKTMERGALSEDTVTNLSGMFMEDVEQSAGDLKDLTARMEKALAESGAKEVELTEEQKKKLAEEADDGW